MNVPNTGILPYALTNTLHICPIACLQEKEKEKEKKKKKKRKKKKKKIKKKKERERERGRDREKKKTEKRKKGQECNIQCMSYLSVKYSNMFLTDMFETIRSVGYKACNTLGKGWADGWTDEQMN